LPKKSSKKSPYFQEILPFIVILFKPVTRRAKGYTRFVGKYVTGRRKRFRPHKVYIYIYILDQDH